MERIEKQHEFNKKLVNKFKIQNGTEMVITHNGEERKAIINWINPFYHWFGENGIWILPEKIISIDGKDVKEQISKIKEEMFVDKQEAKPI